jgi:hypothetical protein
MADRRVWSFALPLVVAALWLGGGARELAAQLLPFNVKYNSGQNVQPVFEGWSRNPDGSFTFHFGYLNRNYVEDVHVPIGPDNQIEPNGPDRGQPTFFYTRVNRYAFGVVVPKDWDKRREVIWTVTANGKTDKAFGWLQAEWEVDQGVILSNTLLSARGRGEGNQPPVLTIDRIPPASVGAATTLTALVTDDGLPKPGTGRRRAAVGQETPPTLQNMPEAPVNVPAVSRDGERGRRSGPPPGLSVNWIVWRGPVGVRFDPSPYTPVKDGRALTTATFEKAGEYVLRARSTDTVATVTQDVTVTVSGQGQAPSRAR